ncbi:MFS transporter [Amycolatopsis dongchuanensis]|uniref:MFS transporter n=1 Tax=Amycolatopsis dongchuanensis TaxID=1070866 RepID=A0ABP9QK86_9PSEU
MGSKPVARGAVALAVGIVALEFGAAVTSFVASTLLPVVAAGLSARDRLGLLTAGTTLGLFVALPLAGRVVHRLGARLTLTAGLAGYLAGLGVAASAVSAELFALGQFLAGFSGGVLGVFGISSAIEHLDERLRVRVVAASSAMWILPALVGPAATLALEHWLGWRWTLLAPVPVVLLGRLFVGRAALRSARPQGPPRPVGRALLVPAGATVIAFGAGGWPVTLAGAAVAFAGAGALLPPGSGRLRRGTPAAVAALVLFAFGYFGADSLITVLLTDGYGTPLAQAAIVLSGAPLAWAVTSLLVPRLVRRHGKGAFPVAGLAVAAAGVGVVAAMLLVAPSFPAALVSWTVAGVGVGIAYPALYVMATTAGTTGLTPTELATSAIAAEAIGGVLGRAVGGALSSAPGTGGLFASYVVFALVLAGGAAAGTRAS